MPTVDQSELFFANVKIPSVGAFVEVDGKSYEVIGTVTHQEMSPDKPYGGQFTTILTLLAVDDEGDDLGEESITVNEDMHDIKYI